MKIITVALMCMVVAELAYSQEPKKSEAASLQGHDEIISRLGTAYAAFNRGDFDAAVAVLVPKIEWTLLISASQARLYRVVRSHATTEDEPNMNTIAKVTNRYEI